jgi:hypothetical protein
MTKLIKSLALAATVIGLSRAEAGTAAADHFQGHFQNTY